MVNPGQGLRQSSVSHDHEGDAVGETPSFVRAASVEIKAAVNQLDAITGRNIDEDLLDRIFSEFCIGK